MSKNDSPVFFIAFLCNNFFEKCDILGEFLFKKSIIESKLVEVENDSLVFHLYGFFMQNIPPKSGIYVLVLYDKETKKNPAWTGPIFLRHVNIYLVEYTTKSSVLK